MTLKVALTFAVVTMLAACARPVPVATSPVVPTPISHSTNLNALVEVAGQYTLITVDGHALPFAPTHTGVTADEVIPEIASSSLLVQGDGTFTMVVRYRKVVDGVEQFSNRTYTGTCAGRDRVTYVLALDGSGTTEVSLVGDKLYLNNEGMQFSYERRR